MSDASAWFRDLKISDRAEEFVNRIEIGLKSRFVEIDAIKLKNQA